jgi:excinuclease ABC subunit C
MTDVGVYILYNEKDEILYVGKATNLKQRIAAHHQQIPFSRYSTIKTASEREALLLEANLIKKYRPLYNVKLRDDKAYPFIKVTINEDYPRFLMARRIEEKARYFGPYTDSKSLRQTFRILREFFKIRTCYRKKPYFKNKPCLRFHLEQCSAPCCNLISKEDYRKKVEEACLFLSGKHKKLINLWEKEMKRFAQNLQYEAAKVLRDRIVALQHITSSQRVIFTKPLAVDVIWIENLSSSEAILTLCIVRQNCIQGILEFHLHLPPSASKEFALEEFLKQHYLYSSTDKESGHKVPAFSLLSSPPQEILVPYQIKDNSIKTIFSKNKCEIKIPKKNSEKYKLVTFAEEHTKRLLKERNISLFTSALEELKQILNLKKIPKEILMVDLATLAGKHNCGAIVSFRDGAPNKSNYRRFRIKEERSRSDLAFLQEVLKRYFSKRRNFEDANNLLIIDGGKAHLNSASKVIEELNIKGLELISVAKGELEKIYTLDKKEPILLNSTSNALNLLRYISSEAHRFAHSYMHKLQKKYLGI